MKAGVRALGIAESYHGDDATGSESTLAAAVVRADQVVDGLAYTSCTVGGTDATAAVCELVADLDRLDVQYILLGAVAPAWYNILTLSQIARTADRPVLAVTFEDSDGLEAGIRDAFSGAERDQRLETYRSLPERQAVSVGEERIYLRCVGLEFEAAAEVVRGFTPEGGRPEPIRVARLAARAGDTYARSGTTDSESERRKR